MILFPAHFHQRSSAMWINLATTVISFNSIPISVGDSSSQLGSIEISLTERQTKTLRKDHHTCANYDTFEEYDYCVKAFFTAEMSRALNCRLPGKT